MEWIGQLRPATGPWSPAELAARRASDAQTIGSAVDAIGPGAVAWAIETAERITQRFENEGETIGVPAASTGFSRQGAEAGLLNALVAMAMDTPADDMRISPALTSLARVAVRQGMPVDALIHKAWASHAASQDEMLEMIGLVVPPEQQVATIRAMSTAMFAYGNATVRALTDAYQEERRNWDGRLPEERRRIVAALVRSDQVPPDAEAALGVPLSGGHRFAHAFSARGAHLPDLEDTIDRFARDAARLIGADRVIVLPHDAAVQIWWTSAAAPRPDAAALLRAHGLPGGVRLALGPGGVGIQGFRDSFHGAKEAARVARAATEGDIWDYDEIAHLALLLSDRAAARRFVRHRLGPLLGPGERLVDIRTTLRRYLETGNSRVVVAKELHIAPSTVAYRVALAEELLGPAIRERSAQLQLALQLVQLAPELGD